VISPDFKLFCFYKGNVCRYTEARYVDYGSALATFRVFARAAAATTGMTAAQRDALVAALPGPGEVSPSTGSGRVVGGGGGVEGGVGGGASASEGGDAAGVVVAGTSSAKGGGGGGGADGVGLGKIRASQHVLNAVIRAGLPVDGRFGPKSAAALGRFLAHANTAGDDDSDAVVLSYNAEAKKALAALEVVVPDLKCVNQKHLAAVGPLYKFDPVLDP
jgi:hypothetical protein